VFQVQKGYTMTDYATLLRDHITLTCRSIDRIFLQAYVPKLQSVGQVCLFLHRQRGFPIPSSVAFGQIGEAYVAAIHRWADVNGVPVRYFAKGENKEKIAEPLLRAAAQQGGDGKVVLIGIAQEKASAWRSWKKKGHEKARHPHMEWGRQMVFVNHFYFYLWDPEWGPAFWKTNAYAPYPIWLWLNGHSWAKRQLQQAGIAFEALDNGFRSCADPAALRRVCNRLGASAVHTFFWRWFHRLPSPFTADDLHAGYGYELAFRQFEVSDTRVFDRPQTGRAFFEGVIRDHLDVGRPDQVVLIFDRKLMPHTPGRFTTRVVTRGVNPQLYCTYKSSRLKQYFKLGKALRTETVIGDTRDFGIGRRLCALNWTALRAVGDSANRRLCDAEAQTARPAPDVVTLTHVTRPSTTTDGLHAPALCFGDPRVMALLAALVLFTHAFDGFDNRQLVSLVRRFWTNPYSSRQATYDLRRLRRKALIMRLPHSNRYQLTPFGRRVAVLFTKAHGRVLAPGLALLDPLLPHELARRSPIATAWRHLDLALNEFVDRQLLAA
jgi:hypothetical protein